MGQTFDVTPIETGHKTYSLYINSMPLQGYGNKTVKYEEITSNDTSKYHIEA